MQLLIYTTRRGKKPPPLQVRNLEEIAERFARKNTNHQQIIDGFRRDNIPESVIQDYIDKHCPPGSDIVYVLYDNKEIFELFQVIRAFQACFKEGQIQDGRRIKTILTGLIPSEIVPIAQSLGYTSKTTLLGVAKLADYYIKHING